MTSEFDDEVALLNGYWAVSRATIGRLHRLLKLGEMRAEQMLQIGSPRAVPCDSKDLSRRRCEFSDHLARGRTEFVDAIRKILGDVQGSAESSLVLLDRCSIASQGGITRRCAEKRTQHDKANEDLSSGLVRTELPSPELLLDFPWENLGCHHKHGLQNQHAYSYALQQVQGFP